MANRSRCGDGKREALRQGLLFASVRRRPGKKGDPITARVYHGSQGRRGSPHQGCAMPLWKWDWKKARGSGKSQSPSSDFDASLRIRSVIASGLDEASPSGGGRPTWPCRHRQLRNRLVSRRKIRSQREALDRDRGNALSRRAAATEALVIEQCRIEVSQSTEKVRPHP